MLVFTAPTLPSPPAAFKPHFPPGPQRKLRPPSRLDAHAYALEACPASPAGTSPPGLAAIPAEGTTDLYLPPLVDSPLYDRLRIWLAP